jgi:hypothetical protein
VPLACGGPDAAWNMQWQTVADARAKDAWAREGVRSVIRGAAGAKIYLCNSHTRRDLASIASGSSSGRPGSYRVVRIILAALLIS